MKPMQDYPRIRLAGGEYVIANASFHREMPNYVVSPVGSRVVTFKEGYALTTVTLELTPVYGADADALMRRIHEGGLIDEISGVGSLARMQWQE